MHAVHAALKNDPLKPIIGEHKSPHFAMEMKKVKKNWRGQRPPDPYFPLKKSIFQ